MRLSLFCRPHQVPGGDLRGCIDVARAADAAGFYGFLFGDHLLMGERTDRYPYGQFAHSLDTPWLEPLTTLAAIASVTERIRLSTGVLLTPLRPAVLLAKTVATLDVLSHGRVELGIGSGWQREEYQAAGLDWGARQQLFEDGIRACRRLWGDQPAHFHSPTVNFGRVWALPRPVQHRIPLLYGVAPTDRNVATMAELGDGWCPVGLGPDQVREGSERVRAAFSAAGRDDSPIVQVSVGAALGADGRLAGDQTVGRLHEMRAAGATVVAVILPDHFTTLAQALEFVAELAEAASLRRDVNEGVDAASRYRREKP